MTISRRTFVLTILGILVAAGVAVTLALTLPGSGDAADATPTKLVCEVTDSDGKFVGQRDAELTSTPCGFDLPTIKHEGDSAPGYVGATVTLKRVPIGQPPSQLTKS
ncbi:hypothetical protein ACQPXB_35795 [Amycolatopsis sp. CA-161197]|uniref:hypothetical protein n=1 Tax=Amycolatopsis sp. CA-161197 TaxID=3239922 RepID=UPI003D934A5F